MADEDMKLMMNAVHQMGDFQQIIFEHDEPTEADYAALIKAAEDILKIAGAR